MNALETRYLDECSLDFKPILYRRYVDDTFCLFKSPEHIDLFLQYISGFHPNIIFTVEAETGDALPFLDVCIRKTALVSPLACIIKKTFRIVY